jgi:hypothetical protein
MYELFQNLKKLSESQRKSAYIYLDEQTNQIKEIPLSKLNDSSASAYIKQTIRNPAKEIHKAIFG